MTGDASLDDFLDAGDDGSGPSESGDADSAGDAEPAPPGGDTPPDDADTAPPDGNDDAGADDSGPAPPGGHDDAGADDAGTDVEPVRPTYGWTPGEATCDACGAGVDRRWRDGDAMVCADCKEW